MRRVLLLASMLACLGAARAASASDDGLPCGRRLVGIGDSQALVLDRCGDPDARTTRLETRFYLGRPFLVTVDDWVYRLGSRRFTRRALFENGRLVSIEAISR